MLNGNDLIHINILLIEINYFVIKYHHRIAMIKDLKF